MTFPFEWLPSAASILSAVFYLYASICATKMIIRMFIYELIPRPLMDYLVSRLSDSKLLLNFCSFSLVIEQRWEAVNNVTYRAVEAYLPTIIGSASIDGLLIGSNNARDSTSVPETAIPVGTKIIDRFQGMCIEWTLHLKEARRYYFSDRKYFLLTCSKKHRERVVRDYLPHVLRMAKLVLDQRKDIYIHSYNHRHGIWESSVFDHPSTFENLAMASEKLKGAVLDDLNKFVNRQGYFQRVGRAWKRGYLLYGPAGTGKTALVAAIANYLSYSIYDLQFQSVRSDAELRNILISTTNRSILLVEDIDCSKMGSYNRHRSSDPLETQGVQAEMITNRGVTLSGLLNFIDGLWSICGEERIIIFTTNDKEKMDPALLRPGRMDVQIRMGYCTAEGIRMLVETYKGETLRMFYIYLEMLMKHLEIPPAEMTEELLKMDYLDFPYNSIVRFIKKKRKELKERGGRRDEADRNRVTGLASLADVP